MTAHLLALDAGTTGVTGVVFDADLVPVARAAREFAQGFPRPGWVEHRADDILRALDEVLAELFAGGAAESVAAIGVTNQRETVFALERSSGKALGPGIVWQDRRTAERCVELREAGHRELVSSRTGLVLDPYFSATKIEWMLADDPAVRIRARAGEVLFATVDTLVIAHLTGNAVHATDPTNAARTMLFGLDEREWDADLLALFGLQRDWLPEVRSSVGDFGSSLAERTGGRSIPITGVAGDQQAALFGQGCLDAGDFKATFGTGSFLLLNTGDKRVDSRAGLLTTLAASADGSPAYALEGSVFMCGAVVQWLRDQMQFFESAAEIEALAGSVDDADGVVLVPAFAGLGAPHWDPDARGAILGMTRGTTRAHVARAALDALAFQNAELLAILRTESDLAIDTMLADGGAAANDLLMQIQSDLGGVRVLRPASVEATARGSAALAGIGIGLWKDPRETRALSDEPRAFEPTLADRARRERMADWRQAVSRVRTR